MNKVFQKKYKSFEKDIDNFIKSFDSINSQGYLIKDARNKLKIFQVKDIKINVKSFKTPNIINQIIYGFFRKSKAKRSFENANRLLNLGIKTPEPIAYYEYNFLFFFKKSYYISEHIDYNLTFRELDTNYPKYQNILREFTRFTFDLHKKGVNFLDHSPGNTLIKIRNNTCFFYLVDLNRMKFENMSFSKGIKNFSRLTNQKNIIKIMSEEYAKCVNKSYNQVFSAMWRYTKKFRRRIYLKRKFKENLFLNIFSN